MYAVAIQSIQDCDVVMLFEQFSDCLCLSVYRLDENVAGDIEEGEFVEPEDQDQVPFAEQGKLLSELAPKYICIYFDQMIYS